MLNDNSLAQTASIALAYLVDKFNKRWGPTPTYNITRHTRGGPLMNTNKSVGAFETDLAQLVAEAIRLGTLQEDERCTRFYNIYERSDDE